MSRRILVILFLLTAAMQAATGTAPAGAFPPFPPMINLNPNYWSGWVAGEVVAIPLPDTSMPDWWTYIAAVRQSEMPRYRLGPFFPISYNDGFDDAEEVAANYFWRTSATSCHNVVCQQALKKKSLAPRQVTHLDLVGKGVKAVTKTAYKGARVIL